MRPPHHSFLFEPGLWVGQGSVSFDSTPGQMFFTTTWRVSPIDSNTILCEQQVKMEEVDEVVKNIYSITPSNESKFMVELETESLGKVLGSGLIDKDMIAWEVLGETNVQGYEVYELQIDGEYTFHAEYASPNQFRTLIEGHIRKQ